MNQDQIHHLLSRATVDVIVRKDLEEKLRSGKKLRIKLGIDPSGADLHIGHMVVIKKLQEFQRAGHHIMLLFGNFTGQIGDPTGKNETRTGKTQKELEKNAEKYLEQAGKILDPNKVEIMWNADWLSKLNFSDVIHLAKNFTVQQMIERDMFDKRLKEGKPIHMHEFFYPLMQGYDSVPMRADVELGGTDQTFNLLAGRTIQKAYDQAPQNIITVPILVGTDGSEKMGKSTGNYIGVSDSPKDIYGKTMSIPDNLLIDYFTLATDIPDNEIAIIKQALAEGENPKNLKMRLARELVTIYHNSELAQKAEQEFSEIFQKGGLPDDIPTKNFPNQTYKLIDLIFETGLTSTKSDARRMIEQGAVKIDEQRIDDIEHHLNLQKETLLQVGKRKFLKVAPDA